MPICPFISLRLSQGSCDRFGCRGQSWSYLTTPEVLPMCVPVTCQRPKPSPNDLFDRSPHRPYMHACTPVCQHARGLSSLRKDRLSRARMHLASHAQKRARHLSGLRQKQTQCSSPALIQPQIDVYVYRRTFAWAFAFLPVCA